MERLQRISQEAGLVAQRKTLDAIVQSQDFSQLYSFPGYEVKATQEGFYAEATNCLQWILGTDDYEEFTKMLTKATVIDPDQRKKGDYIIYFTGEEINPLTFTDISFVTEDGILTKLAAQGPLVHRTDIRLVPGIYGDSYIVVRPQRD